MEWREQIMLEKVGQLRTLSIQFGGDAEQHPYWRE